MEQADKIKAELVEEEKKGGAVKESISATGRSGREIQNAGSAVAGVEQRAQRSWRRDRRRFARSFRAPVRSKGDAAIVALEHNVCTGCHMKVTTATVMHAKTGKEIVSCEQCGRILYSAE